MKRKTVYTLRVILALAILVSLPLTAIKRELAIRRGQSEGTLHVRGYLIPLNDESVPLKWYWEQLDNNPNWRDFEKNYQGTFLQHTTVEWNGGAVRSFSPLDSLDEHVEDDSRSLVIKIFGSEKYSSQEAYFIVLNMNYDPSVVDGVVVSAAEVGPPSISGFVLYGANTSALPWAHARFAKGSVETVSITGESLKMRFQLYFDGTEWGHGEERARVLISVNGTCHVPVRSHLAEIFE